MNILWGFYHQIFEQLQRMAVWEGIAVLLALFYLFLAMKTNIWCWGAAFVSTAIYTVLFWKVALLMESVLNLYYMVMALYGYWLWRWGGNQHSGVLITSWSWRIHLGLISGTGLVSLLVGHGMARFTPASFPYWDAATTCFAVMTTYLVARKVLENWLYWVIIDLVSIYLYISKGLILTAMLFVFYVLMAIAGYVIWRESMVKKPLTFASV